MQANAVFQILNVLSGPGTELIQQMLLLTVLFLFLALGVVRHHVYGRIHLNLQKSLPSNFSKAEHFYILLISYFLILVCSSLPWEVLHDQDGQEFVEETNQFLHIYSKGPRLLHLKEFKSQNLTFSDIHFQDKQKIFLNLHLIITHEKQINQSHLPKSNKKIKLIPVYFCTQNTTSSINISHTVGYLHVSLQSCDLLINSKKKQNFQTPRLERGLHNKSACYTGMKTQVQVPSSHVKS